MGKLFITEMGQPTEVNAVRYYTKNDQNYLIYTKNEKDDQGYVKLYAMKIINENGELTTTDITNPVEWNEVRETVKQIVNESRENIPSSIQNLDMNVLENLNVTEKHVFKLAENIVEKLAFVESDMDGVEENTMDTEAAEQNNMEEMNSVENGMTTPFDMFQPTFDQVNEENNEIATEVENQDEKQNDIDELDLSDVSVEQTEQNVEEPMQSPMEETTSETESVVLPEEELADVALMNVAEDHTSTEELGKTWDQFEMPVPPVEENKVEETDANETVESTPIETEESKPRGFFESLFGKKQKEPEVENNVDENKKSDDVEELPVSEDPEGNQDASLEETQLLNDVANEIQNMNQPESFVENPLPVDEEGTVEVSTEESNEDNEMNQSVFDYQNFDPVNEAPSYEIPSFESLGLDQPDMPKFGMPSEGQPKSDVNLEEANYQTLYFEEKRKNEDLEEKIHLLEIQLEDQKRKIEDVKNIIL